MRAYEGGHAGDQERGRYQGHCLRPASMMRMMTRILRQRITNESAASRPANTAKSDPQRMMTMSGGDDAACQTSTAMSGTIATMVMKAGTNLARGGRTGTPEVGATIDIDRRTIETGMEMMVDLAAMAG